MRCLLDTNTPIYIINSQPRHAAVVERFSREHPEDLCVCTITLAELRYGIAKSKLRLLLTRAQHSGLQPML